MTTEDPRYPIGRFHLEGEITPERRAAWIEEIAALPGQLRAAVAGLSAEQLDTPYRTGGWTARQVVHHVPDSHMNAYVRFKLALTEDEPTVKPYDEVRWAVLPDTKKTPVEVSLALTAALHERWTVVLRCMSPEDFARTIYHPEHKRKFTLDYLLAQYAWHGKHHVAHITSLRKRMGW